MTDQVPSESDARTVNNTVRHNYRVLTEAEKARMVEIKDLAAAFLALIDDTGTGREYSLAKTKVEEACMWAVKALTS